MSEHQLRPARELPVLRHCPRCTDAAGVHDDERSNAFLGCYQEYRAEQPLARCSQFASVYVEMAIRSKWGDSGGQAH